MLLDAYDCCPFLSVLAYKISTFDLLAMINESENQIIFILELLSSHSQLFVSIFFFFESFSFVEVLVQF
jgi:hypothetical protein